MKVRTFSERLNISLDQLGFPPKHCGRIQQLAEMVGLSHRGAGKWISGESKPPAKKYPKLAELLNVNEQWLRTGEGQMCLEGNNRLPLPPLGISLEIPIYSIQQLHECPAHTLTCILPYEGPFYGLILGSEAMSPRFPLGSILIMDKQAEPKDGDFILAVDSGYPEPLFRQLLIAQNTWYLHAHNPKFERLTLTSPTQILGKLIQAIVCF